MTARKTRESRASVGDFLGRVANETRRRDSLAVAKMMRRVTGKQARMWGTSIVGFGKREYAYANGGTGEICKVGFAPRAQSLVFYLGSFDGRAGLLRKLGKHRTGSGGCIYVNKLADVDLEVLEEMIARAYERAHPRDT